LDLNAAGAISSSRSMLVGHYRVRQSRCTGTSAGDAERITLVDDEERALDLGVLQRK